MGRSNVLYMMSVFLLSSQCVDARSFMRLSDFWAFVVVLFVWMEKFSFESKVRPRMVGLEMVEMGVLLIWMFSGLLYSEGSGVMSGCGWIDLEIVSVSPCVNFIEIWKDILGCCVGDVVCIGDEVD